MIIFLKCFSSCSGLVCRVMLLFISGLYLLKKIIVL